MTGSWEHMAVKVPEPMVHRKRLKNSFQEAAEKAEDYGLLASAIGKYRTETVETAVNLLRSEALYRSENVLGMAEWFLEVLQLVKEKRDARNRGHPEHHLVQGGHGTGRLLPYLLQRNRDPAG